MVKKDKGEKENVRMVAADSLAGMKPDLPFPPAPRIEREESNSLWDRCLLLDHEKQILAGILIVVAVALILWWQLG